VSNFIVFFIFRSQADGGTYAFVQFGVPDHAQAALRALNGFLVAGRELKVRLAAKGDGALNNQSSQGGRQVDLVSFSSM
jgi:RNA recognition motif-containing protein